MKPREIFRKGYIIKRLQQLQGIFKKDFIVGLDIGTTSIKIAQFRNLEDGLHLVRADLREIKQTGDNAIREKEILSVLKDLFRGIDIKKSKIIVNINCPQTVIKKITAPYMPKAELGDGIRLEAKNYFPFPIDQSLLDFEVLGDIVEKGVRKYEVVVAVCPTKTVEKYLSLLGKAGIKPNAFVSSAYALQKLAVQARISESETKCFLDIGALYTELVIFKGKNLLFSRKIPVAGRDFTKAMTGVLISERGKIELSLDEAEKIKQQTGIPQGTESKIIDDKISTTQILAMLRTPLEQLISEIERCFDYYREESGGGKIDALVLFGRGALLAGLVKSLYEGLGIEVTLGDSLRDLTVEKDAIPQRDKIKPQLSLAIGAALSAKAGINLLPPEIKEETKRVVRRGTFEAIATAVILILILFYVGMKIELSNFQKRIAVARLELYSLQPQLKRAQIQVFANKVLSQEPYWQDLFKELSNLIPDQIYLTNMSMRNNVITMKGIVNAAKDAEKLVSNFILVLEKGIFSNVMLVGTKDLGENAGTEFELRCRVDYD
jgi:type IV pilus assembly protein PilM